MRLLLDDGIVEFARLAKPRRLWRENVRNEIRDVRAWFDGELTKRERAD
jgi:hypothetical protein